MMEERRENKKREKGLEQLEEDHTQAVKEARDLEKAHEDTAEKERAELLNQELEDMD